MLNLKNNKLIYLIIILIIILLTLLIFDSDDEQNLSNFVPTAIATITPEAIITPTPISILITPTINSSKLITPTIEKIQPTPVPPRSYIEEMGRLIYEKNINGETLFLKSVSTNEWDDESLGCPQSGEYYSDKNKPYKGYKYILSDGENDWEYRTDLNDTYIIRCSEIIDHSHELINISYELDLFNTKEIKLYRWNFDDNEFFFLEKLEEKDQLYIIDILDTELILSTQESCQSLFMLEFQKNNTKETLEFICAENKTILFGSQNFWNKKQATAPNEIGEVIGSYLTGQPIPTIPEQ